MIHLKYTAKKWIMADDCYSSKCFHKYIVTLNECACRKTNFRPASRLYEERKYFIDGEAKEKGGNILSVRRLCRLTGNASDFEVVDSQRSFHHFGGFKCFGDKKKYLNYLTFGFS